MKAVRVIFIIAAFALLLAQGNMAQGAEGAAGKKPQQQMTVTITPADSVGAPWTFRVVLLCDTPASRSIGLQGFRPLAKDEAALFAFDKPAQVVFWMGSVAFPIDIIFVGPDRKVATIYQNCLPGSRELYPSGKKAKWVIETAVGSGIKPGDKVEIK